MRWWQAGRLGRAGLPTQQQRRLERAGRTRRAEGGASERRVERPREHRLDRAKSAVDRTRSRAVCKYVRLSTAGLPASWEGGRGTSSITRWTSDARPKLPKSAWSSGARAAGPTPISSPHGHTHTCIHRLCTRRVDIGADDDVTPDCAEISF